ncbi:hypothetical protein DES32_1527 [Methylovirgula ligni]|uniref:Uncharacterized protein n=1 Tax=Methylovirgula ligni TaxID=569860 RepID=A0A3D9Z1L8_9HYPH|nr:hypothetical protein [Methylovirgula ligni]REF87890.1 hypothetical protein DES32_1527 [Methylovirgula ligni]
MQQIFDDKLLSAAAGDIAKMPVEELNSFRDYLAACDDRFSNNELVKHDCNVAHVKYDIQFNGYRALDKVLALLDFSILAMEATEGAGKPTDGKLFARVEDICSKLQHWTNLAYAFVAVRQAHNH